MGKEKVSYRSDFAEAYGYDGNIDYTKEVELWNKATEEGDKQAQRELLDRHGGIISLIAKRQYQRDRREALQEYTDEELSRELRLRGFEVWKWDKLPEWKDNKPSGI